MYRYDAGREQAMRDELAAVVTELEVLQEQVDRAYADAKAVLQQDSTGAYVIPHPAAAVEAICAGLRSAGDSVDASLAATAHALRAGGVTWPEIGRLLNVSSRITLERLGRRP